MAWGDVALPPDAVLRRFRDEVIRVEMPKADPARGLPRDALLEEIARQRLDDPDYVHRKIPLASRERTDPEEARRCLEQVCGLVAGHAGAAPHLHWSLEGRGSRLRRSSAAVLVRRSVVVPR